VPRAEVLGGEAAPPTRPVAAPCKHKQAPSLPRRCPRVRAEAPCYARNQPDAERRLRVPQQRCR
jgi:hypothetical protein